MSVPEYKTGDHPVLPWGIQKKTFKSIDEMSLPTQITLDTQATYPRPVMTVTAQANVQVTSCSYPSPPPSPVSSLTHPLRKDSAKADKQYTDLTCAPHIWAAKIWRESWYNDLVLTPAAVEDLLTECPDAEDVPPCAAGDLPNALHPLFSREHWLLDAYGDRTEELWMKLQPALRLASKFLSTPQVMHAWLPVAYGVEVPIENSDPKRTILQFETPCPDAIPSMIDTVIKELANIQQHEGVKFCFSLFRDIHDWEAKEAQLKTASETDPTNTNSKKRKRKGPGIATKSETKPQIHGLHIAPNEPLRAQVYVQGDPFVLKPHADKHRVFLNAAYAEFLLQADGSTPSARITSTMFNLGMTIAHEIFHVFFWHRRRPETCNYTEPLYTADQDSPELGCGFERALFGTVLNAIINPKCGVHMECLHHPCAWVHGKPVRLPGKISTHLAYFPEPRVMHTFLTQAYWDAVAKLPVVGSEGCTRFPEFRYWLLKKTANAAWQWMLPLGKTPEEIEADLNKWRAKDQVDLLKAVKTKSEGTNVSKRQCRGWIYDD